MREGKSRRLYQIVYRAFYVALLFGICLTSFGAQLGIREPGVEEILCGAILLCGLLGVSYCQMRGKLIWGVCYAAAGMMLLFLTGGEESGSFLQHYFDWLAGGSTWNAEWINRYEIVQSGVLLLGLYLLQVLAERLPLIKDILAVLLLGNLVACMYLEKVLGQVAVSLVLWYILLCFIERTQRHWNKKKEGGYREYLLRLLPFCGLYLLLMCLMPAPEKPYDWQFVKDAYAKLHDKFTTWAQDAGRNGQEDFAVAEKGFSGSGRLMSSLIDNDRELFTIQGSSGLRTNVYLVGKVYDTFDGRQWTQTITEDTDEHLMDTLETIYAIERYDGELAENYVYSTGLSVRYEYFNTGYLFVPLKLQSLSGCEFQSNGGNLLLGEQKGYGTEYKVIYYQLNVDHPEFYRMADTQLADDVLTWETIVGNYAPREKRRIPLEDLKQYQRSVHENYDREVVLSETVLEQLAQITEGAETVTEKLRAIEGALSGLTYTEAPGDMPEEIQSEGAFLDYFLLEKQEGYCSYFATAFVLLARAEGIPARYVEGFCVPITSDKNMTVTSDMAHAWPEVYLGGVGWIPFEPTPGYSEIRYTPWKLKTEKSNDDSFEYEYEYEEEDLGEESEATLEETVEAVAEAPRTENAKSKWLIAMMALVIVLGCLLVVVLDKVLFQRKYERMTLGEQFEIEVKRNLWLLSRLGFTREDYETIAELQCRIATEERPALEFLGFYEDYRYGSREITAEMLQVTCEERKELLLWLKQLRKWYYYFVVLRLYIGKIDR